MSIRINTLDDDTIRKMIVAENNYTLSDFILKELPKEYHYLVSAPDKNGYVKPPALFNTIDIEISSYDEGNVTTRYIVKALFNDTYWSYTMGQNSWSETEQCPTWHDVEKLRAKEFTTVAYINEDGKSRYIVPWKNEFE